VWVKSLRNGFVNLDVFDRVVCERDGQNQNGRVVATRFGQEGIVILEGPTEACDYLLARLQQNLQALDAAAAARRPEHGI